MEQGNCVQVFGDAKGRQARRGKAEKLGAPAES